ncbi:MAG: hypothetical protein H7125_01745 [Proteobacteria bacterium]|nr:hypothetical protein [Burkholderiales bacterium]
MPCTSSVTTGVSARFGQTFSSTFSEVSGAPRIVGCLVGLLLVVCNTWAAAPPQTTPCALLAPKYQHKAGVAQFEITVECAAEAPGSKPFPVGVDMLIGLTVYAGEDAKTSPMNSADHFSRRVVDAAPEVRTALDRATQSKSVLMAGSPKWIVLSDESAASHDVAAKVVRIVKAGTRLTVRFEDNEKAFAGKQHFVFAAWPATERMPCKKASRYARSGCRRDGYVIGSGGVAPIAAYPGLEINHFAHPSGESWTAERWIVERFR